MSDDVHYFVPPPMTASAAHDVAVHIHALLVERNVIETRLTNCGMHDTGAFRPTEGVAFATATPLALLVHSRVCGLEFSFARTIYADWGEGYSGTHITCPHCGWVYDIENGHRPELAQLNDWLRGGGMPALSCKGCHQHTRIDNLAFDPVWKFAEFAAQIWNWGVLHTHFVEYLLGVMPPGTTLIYSII